MENSPQLYVYKASAGSGKTFTLAVQYISQLMADPHAYRHILAVTFTNKATAEMKDRILGQLYGLATHDPASDGYLTAIQTETHLDEQDIRKAASDALLYIIHDYSRFRIETIDSFFQSVMRNLARELELGANLAIELNTGEVLSDAVDLMIEKLDRNSPVLNWLLEYISERIEADRRWNVSDELKSFGRNIFDEEYIERGQGLRKKLEDPSFIPNFRKTVNALREEALEQMKGFSEHFIEVLDCHGLKPDDLKSGSRGIGSYFRKLSEGQLGNEISNATVQKCLNSADEWTSKSSPLRDVIRQAAETELIDILQEAEQFRMRNNIIVNSCVLALRHLNNLRLLARIDDEVRLLNQSCNRFMLSDTNALLHRLIQEGDASFVYEKIGTTIDTVMIDEFQDTSRLQWENFRLLLQESLAQKEGSLIVGDIKQSIYRWRNGDWKILANIDKDKAFHVKNVPIKNNWRSEARIVHFNNCVFKQITDHLGKEDKSGLLLNAYEDVYQNAKKSGNKGYVRLSFLNDDREWPYAEQTLKELANTVEHLHANGVALNDIAILVRKNKVIPVIADYFDKETSYRVVSDEAFRLDASLTVCMLMDGLRGLAMPDDRIALARLAVTYQNEVCHTNTDMNTILLNKVEDYLPEEYMTGNSELYLMPLYDLIEKLYDLFHLQEITEQDAYLCAFHDALTDYLRDHTSELTSFIQYWDETLHEKTIPSGELDGIRILSIHKSKGLEYHTVLLPFCDWKMENETNNHMIWCTAPQNGDEELHPFCDMDLLPVNYSSAMAESIFKDSYLNERLQLWIDNINLLYVAFTRARCNLIVWCKSGQKGTVSELLESVIPKIKDEEVTLKSSTIQPPGNGEEDSECPEFTQYEYGELCPSANKQKDESDNRLTAEPDSHPIHIESLETTVEFKQSNRSADFINGDDDNSENYIRQGQLLHEVFASIKTASDLPAVMEQLTGEGVIESTDQEKRIYGLAEKALKNPKVQKWYDGTSQLYNECAIIFTDENGSLQTRRPDRVMIKNGKVTIVDFKFGKKKDSYREQVKEYMDLLNEMGYQQTEGYLWYVYTDELEQVN